MLETLEKDGKIKTMKEETALLSPDLNYRSLGENVEGRDNQQERLRKLIWVSAMLECEGTFTFQYNEQTKLGKIHSHLQPRIIFVNSDMKLVDAVENMAKALGYTLWRRDGIRGGLGKKSKSELQYNGFKALPLLKELRPFIVGDKSEIVDCLIKFIEYRQNLDQPKQKYGDFEFDLFRRVREINSGHWNNTPKFSLVSSETVRQRRENAKIQSGLHGDMQRSAEMTDPLVAVK
jgi:hypothetical protein